MKALPKTTILAVTVQVYNFGCYKLTVSKHPPQAFSFGFYSKRMLSQRRRFWLLHSVHLLPLASLPLPKEVGNSKEYPREIPASPRRSELHLVRVLAFIAFIKHSYIYVTVKTLLSLYSVIIKTLSPKSLTNHSRQSYEGLLKLQHLRVKGRKMQP